MNIERRNFSGTVGIEERSDGGKRLTGYASVFYSPNDSRGTQYQLWPGMMERIAPTAFNRALSEQQDVRALFNHDMNLLLGRSTANTLRLSVDARGLKYEIDLPDTQAGRDVATSIARGDVTGSSFTFQATGRTIEDSGDVSIRTITDVNLIDVGPVTFPAYTGTTAGMRSHDAESIRQEFEQWKQSERTRLSRLRRLHEIELKEFDN